MPQVCMEAYDIVPEVVVKVDAFPQDIFVVIHQGAAVPRAMYFPAGVHGGVWCSA
jgi:hypothetical protein